MRSRIAMLILGCIAVLNADTLLFSYIPVKSMTDTAMQTGHFTIGDFNGDTFPDVAEAARGYIPNQEVINFYMNDKRGGFLKTALPVNGTDFYSPKMTPGDVNNDGKTDIIHYEGHLSSFRYFQNTSSMNFDVSAVYSFWKQLFINQFALHDINRDGYADIAASHLYPPAIEWLENVSGQSFKPPAALAGIENADCFEFVDVDRDGIKEIASLVNTSNNMIYCYQQSPDLSWGKIATIKTVYAVHGFKAADMDKDGDMDFIYVNFDKAIYSVLFNEGTLKFTETAIVTDPPIAKLEWPVCIEPIDADCDGDIDVVAGSGYASVDKVFWLENIANRPYTVHGIAQGAHVINVASSDLDLDGDPDLVVWRKSLDAFFSNVSPDFTGPTGPFINEFQSKISWQGAYKGKVNIQYQLQNDSTWHSIIAAAPSVGSYEWKVPAGLKGKGSLRIADNDKRGLVHKRKIAFCSGALSIIAPCPNQSFTCNDTLPIIWSTTGSVPVVTVDYSFNGGKSWMTIGKNTENKNMMRWKIPGPVSDSCKIRIMSSNDSNCTHESDGFFSITNRPVIILVKPSGGELFKEGSLLSVAWNTSGKIDMIGILLSTDNGISWREITASTPNDGGYVFPVPAGVSSSSCLLRICDTRDTTISDVCDSAFKIKPNAGVESAAGGTTGPAVTIRSSGRGGSAVITISIPRTEAVSMAIYSLMGKTVFRYHENAMNAGIHALPLRCSESSSIVILAARIGKTLMIQRHCLP